MINEEYNDLFRKKQNSRSKTNLRPLAVLLLLTLSFTLILFNKSLNSRFPYSTLTAETKAESVGRTSEIEAKPTSGRTTRSPEKILAEIKKELDPRVRTYSVYVTNIITGESFGINENMAFDAASVNKVPILVSLYLQAQRGGIDLDKIITLQEKDIRDYGTGSLRYEKPGKILSIRNLAQLMMAKSDNTAAYILGNQIVGTKRIQNDIKGWGLEQTDILSNQTSNFDMAILFKRMYTKDLILEPSLTEMLSFMKSTDFEERLPAKLPANVAVYHKTGDQVSIIHDVGVVDLPNKAYYVGIMTKNILVSESEAKEAMATVSKLIFDYQNQL